MLPISRLNGPLTEADQFVGPVSAHNGSLSIFVGTGGTGTLTLQCRPTPSQALPGTSVAGYPAVAAGTPEDWVDMTTTVEAGLTVVAQVPGNFDFRVGYKAGASVSGSANVYLNASS